MAGSPSLIRSNIGRYCDNPDKYGDGTFVVEEGAGYWFVGRKLGGFSREVREKLTGKAKTTGLLGAKDPNAVYDGDNVVYMLAREAPQPAQSSPPPAASRPSAPRDDSGGGDDSTQFPAVPFTVRVLISDLNIRAGAGANTESLGYIKRGVYTIVEIRNGKWGRLKSGDGWIQIANPAWVEVRWESDSSANAMITGNRVNLRAAPNTRSRVLMQMNKGYEVRSIKSTRTSEGTWFQIDTPNGKRGWVFGQYVYVP